MLTLLSIVAFTFAGIFVVMAINYFLQAVRPNPYNLVNEDYLQFHAGMMSAYENMERSRS